MNTSLIIYKFGTSKSFNLIFDFLVILYLQTPNQSNFGTYIYNFFFFFQALSTLNISHIHIYTHTITYSYDTAPGVPRATAS